MGKIFDRYPSNLSRRDFLLLMQDLTFLIVLARCNPDQTQEEPNDPTCPDWSNLQDQCDVRSHRTSRSGISTINVAPGEKCRIEVYQPSIMTSQDSVVPVYIDPSEPVVIDHPIFLRSADPSISQTSYKVVCIKEKQ
jgi:hypothetical protein